MTERIMEMFDKIPTVILATATGDGTPNAVPVGAKKIINRETIVISDQFFNKTLSNIKTNPKVAITFWDGFEGYQLKGTVTIETTGERFEEMARWVEKRGHEIGFPLKSKGVLVMNIKEIYGVSPGSDAGKRLV